MPRLPETVDDYLTEGCGRCDKGGTPDCKVLPRVAVLSALRARLLAEGLEERVKWGAPCYLHAGRNLLLLSALKDAVVLSFLQGAALSDPEGLLEAPGPNSHHARVVRFTTLEEVAARGAAVSALVAEARAQVEAGPPARGPVPDEALPEALAEALAADEALDRAFWALTPGRRRSHILYVGGAKQAATRASRAEAVRARVLAGKGWNER